MEVAIAIFLGLWLSGASFLAWRRLKSDYKDVLRNDQDGKEDEK